MKNIRTHFAIAMVLALLAMSGAHVWLREVLLDARFRILTRPASGNVMLVEIDSASIDRIGVWPWSRKLHAQLIEQLSKAGAASIAFDVDFSSASTPEADAAFADALRNAGGSVVLAAFQQRAVAKSDRKAVHVNKPVASFLEHAWLGLVNISPDPDGIIRNYSYGDVIDATFEPSVGALIAGRQENIRKPFRIDFGILADSIPTVSFADVLNGDPAALAAVQGREVLVSGTAVELGDRFNVPNGAIIPGSVIQVLGAESILQGRTLMVAPVALSISISILVMIGMALLWKRTRAALRALLVLMILVSVEAIAIIMQWRVPIAIDTSLIHVTLLAYLPAIALGEIDLQGVLRNLAERRFQRVAMSLRDGLVSIDAKGCIVDWNPAAASMFGYQAGEILGLPFASLLSKNTASNAGKAFSLRDISPDRFLAPGGYVVELDGCRRSGERFDLECSFSSWETDHGIRYGAVLRDISLRKRQQQRIQYLAENDPVTELPNRNRLVAKLGDTIRDIASLEDAHSLMLVSISQFEQLNNLHGHVFGDRILIAASRRIGELLASDDFLARFGDNEFAIVLKEDAHRTARALGENIIASFHDHVLVMDDLTHRVSVNIGIAEIGSGQSVEELLGNAHFALSAAKVSPSIEPAIYKNSMRAALAVRHRLESELRRALEKHEFVLFYQPQVELATGKLVGVEALIRWQHPERGILSPAEFLSVVNSTSLSDGVAAWVLSTAVHQATVWERAGHKIRMGVNLAQPQFTAGTLVSDVKDVLAETGLTPKLLELEVTENIILDQLESVQFTLEALQKLGVRIAFDDFGTGYGSLTYLKSFPLDKIKIDQTFVRTLSIGTDDAAIVSSTIGLSKALGLSVIAEGIETREVAELLLEMGCQEGQGYYFSRPIAASDFEAKYLGKDN